jgi:hypothetical protein
LQVDLSENSYKALLQDIPGRLLQIEQEHLGSTMAGRLDNEPISVSISTSSEQPGLVLVDTVDNVKYQLETESPPSPTPAERDTFPFPVDIAVTVTAGKLTLPNVGTVTVRTLDGAPRKSLSPSNSPTQLTGPLCLELTTTPLKLYLQFPTEASWEINSTPEATIIRELDGIDILVGARSFQSSPANTITIDQTPAGCMTALSAFGANLKTTSPERTFPTLRGHPPLVKIGETPSIPDGYLSTDTNITLGLPPKFRYIYPSAPLAYFLTANVQTADSPALFVHDKEYPLGNSRPFDTHVSALLKRLFMLEAATRATGLYTDSLNARSRFDNALATVDVSVDWDRLYDAPLATRVHRYLELPTDPLDRVVPEWSAHATVEPSAGQIEHLPFLAYSLTPISCKIADSQPSLAPALESLSQITQLATAPDEHSLDGVAADADIMYPPEVDAATQTWHGPGYPLGACRPDPITQAQQARPTETDDPGTFAIAVVLGRDSTSNEEVVSQEYGTRETDIFDFKIETIADPSRDELVSALGSDLSLLHFIGHIDEDGFRCRDGHIDLRDRDAVECNTDVVILNGCQSVHQGTPLVEAGALAALVSLVDVPHAAASRYGMTVGRALNAGLPVGAAAALATEYTSVGRFYSTIGAWKHTPFPTEGTVPSRIDITPPSGDQAQASPPEATVSITPYPTSVKDIGTMYSPYLESVNQYYVVPSRVTDVTVPEPELRNYLNLAVFPITVEDTLYWTTDASLSATFGDNTG